MPLYYGEEPQLPVVSVDCPELGATSVPIENVLGTLLPVNKGVLVVVSWHCNCNRIHIKRRVLQGGVVN